ncbi:hypothetical protein [Alkalicoccobacillus gibsonii]|jgi:hypothetical protein|uniref:hypothetical protein n=1 Tax=Alkalicoccobacillus gibsonii TaxID=79881 RepID=UPI00351825EC
MVRITKTPTLQMHRVLQHRLQNAVRPNSAAPVEPVSSIAPVTEVISNESANYLYDYERNGWVNRLRTTLKTFYLKERALWKHIRKQRRTIAQFEQFIDTWNETAKQMEKLEQMGLSFQGELRASLKEQSDSLSKVGITVKGLTLAFQRQTTHPHHEWIDQLQIVKVQLYQTYHQLFTLTFQESSSPYEQSPTELQGLIYEKRG